VAVRVDGWLHGTEDFQIERITTPEGRNEARVRLTRSPPPRIAVIVGEAVHGLRAALDNAVFASALHAAGGTLDPDTERWLEFPVSPTAPKLGVDKATERSLKGGPDGVRGVVEDSQPYHYNREHPDGRGFHPVWQVHDLDRVTSTADSPSRRRRCATPRSASPKAWTRKRSSSTWRGAWVTAT
jgi:hypothetical protein